MPSATRPRVVHIHEADLPFVCPPPKTTAWNMHPRVVIQISPKEPEKSCPYCGTQYILKTDNPIPAEEAGNAPSPAKP